jgi:GTP-binding protein
MLVLRNRILASLVPPPPSPLLRKPTRFTFCLPTRLSHSTRRRNPTQHASSDSASASKTTRSPPMSDAARFVRTVLFVPPGVELDEVTDEMVLPGSNIVVGPYAGDARIREVEFLKSSARAKDCPKDDRPEFAILGRSNVGKSSLINALVRKKGVALTSKKPGIFYFFIFFNFTP